MFIKTLAIASVLCIALTYTTKADSFTPDPGSTSTQANFANVQVYGVDNSTNANPWGILCSTYQGANCNGTNNVIHAGADASQAFELATVTFTPNGFSIVQNSPATDKGSATTTGDSSIYASSNLSPLQVLLNTQVTANGTWCTASGCNGPSPVGIGTLRLINVNGTDVFVGIDDSFGLAFAVPTSTPEPSSLLMLGLGLLGLMGLGLRRKETA